MMITSIINIKIVPFGIEILPCYREALHYVFRLPLRQLAQYTLRKKGSFAVPQVEPLKVL